ncbi:hypothetical protein RE428_35410 [Marinobacter nanhaiticus D15-8W]|uniref:Uncharacterized protein n=1 Tax=Marinobacter nanhaiticus D15-8W TaxID=626887 RepID=N6WYW3_9GAMM|nr:hypothetical protein [Marinobacter nanhaiticus]ENO16721.1 hypothetical protein J057_03405 [Marinobacter nanhaiticus D15-8W]BES72523.1 hypothetical protein RE428_35410 [Marinobacter nanhaiticus D15-8W]
MILRIFIILLALNSLAFVVKADAAERVDISDEEFSDIYALQDAMSGDFEQDDTDAIAELGSRILRWSISDSDDGGQRYASEGAQPDHGIALIQNGACLNLKWNF